MTDLERLLPQKSPMILLSGYDESGDDVMRVTAYVDIEASSPFCEAEGVPACVALEYMAQAMALVVGRLRAARGLSAQIGFVLGSRKFETFIPFFARGQRYMVTASCTYEDESFGSFDCTVSSSSGVLAARATMTAYQPSGDMTEEKLEAYE